MVPNLCERHPYAVHIANALNRAIEDAGVKAEWLACVLGISPSILSAYRDGSRSIPAHRIALIDQALDNHRLLRALAEIEGCTVHVQADPIDIGPVSRLLELIQRAHGQVDAELTRALRAGALTRADREALGPLVSQMRRYWQDLEERCVDATEDGDE